MVQISPIVGGEIYISDESIFRIIAPSSEFPYTRVNGPGGTGTIETAEPPEELVDRLKLKVPLAELTRPDGGPVWIKASQVTYIGPPLTNDTKDQPGIVRARIMVSGRLQLVRETPEQVHAVLKELGSEL